MCVDAPAFISHEKVFVCGIYSSLLERFRVVSANFGWGGVGWVSGWVVVWPGQFQYGTVYKHGFSRWTEVFSGSNHCVCRLQK